MQERIPDQQLEAIRRLDACTLTDAIAALKVRLRNQGYSNGALRCVIENPTPMLGYAVTGRIRGAEPPVMGRRFVERNDWLNYIMTIPPPRVVVLQDIDHAAGSGAFWDEIQARIHLHLGCVGGVTNGAVRDVPKIRAIGLSLYAGSISAAQGYAHIVEVGGAVEVGGLVIHPGDLIHGDMHGIVLVPREAVADLPHAAAKIQTMREQVAELCQSADFSQERLRVLLRELG